MGRFGAIRGVFGKGPMATKSKLDLAVEKHAGRLNDAQRELVLSQLSDHKRNRARIAQIEETLRLMDVQPVSGPDGTKVHLAQRMSLTSERAQLIDTNNGIASRLFEQLREDR